jgi:hypothetical protein
MVHVDQVGNALFGLGFEKITTLPGSTFRDNSTVIIIPTRGMISWQVVQSWQSLIPPMNSKRHMMFCVGDEVGHAYNRMVEHILADPELGKWKYILTLEDDNVVAQDVHIRLLETIELGFDAVSGIYFTKNDPGMPMAYGNPATYEKTGELGFEPLDVRDCLDKGRVLEVNGIAMGCALWKIDLLRQIGAPWFQTVNDITSEGAGGMTQDLFFCRRARLRGKRFAVDLRVRVGHLDINTGILY